MSGLGSFVEGAFKGYAFGEGVKNQKQRRKQSGERHEWLRDQQRRATEKHDWARENHDFNAAERGKVANEKDRVRTAADKERSIFTGAYESAEEEYAVNASTTQSETISNTPDQPGAIPTTHGVLSILPDQEAPQPVLRPPDQLPAVSAPDQGPARPQASPSAPTLDIMGRTNSTDGSGQDIRQYLDHLPSRGILPEQKATQLATAGSGLDQIWGLNMMGKPESTGEGDQEVRQYLSQPPTRGVLPDQPSQPVAQGIGLNPPQSVAPQTADQATTPQQPNVGAAPVSPEMQRTELTISSQNKDPNVEAAEAAVATERSILPNPGRTVNQGVKDKARETFLQAYQRVAVPQIMKHYLQTGQVKKAQSFETWIKTTEAVELQKQFGDLTFSLAIGDLDGALDHLDGMYGQVNDGYDLVREKSRFETYPDGQPKRAVFVIRDSRTGKEFEQVVEGQGDLAHQLLGMMNPQAAHEYLLGRQESAITASQKQERSIQKDRISREEVSREFARLKKLVIQESQSLDKLGENSGYVMPTDAEIEQMALESLTRRDDAVREHYLR
ncbi:MAG: hypothetical protein JKY94_10070 [Rhodobacteraceae bacterium]|nr:hypothetical protein [Paracoccaceae bacterium]